MSAAKEDERPNEGADSNSLKLGGPALPESPPLGAILIVDDNADDALLVQLHLKKLRVCNPVQTLNSGEQAMAYIKGEGEYSDRSRFPYPAVVLLDLRMPGADGFDVLRWLQRHNRHQSIPVIALSVMREISQLSRAYQLGARSFLVKPVDREQLKEALKALGMMLAKPDATEATDSAQQRSSGSSPSGSKTTPLGISFAPSLRGPQRNRSTFRGFGADLSDSEKDAALARAGGRCQCQNVKHKHSNDRCNQPLTMDNAFFCVVNAKTPTVPATPLCEVFCYECYAEIGCREKL